MKIALLFVIIGLLSRVAGAATPKDVSFKSDGDIVNAVAYLPDGKGPFPAIVVIHEWWGLNDWVKEQASKLADQGYVTLAVDFYRGKVATTRDQAHELSRTSPSRVVRDARAAFAYLQSRQDVKKDKIGAIGWCWGGGYSLQLAIEEPTLAADVINYGDVSASADELKKINAPILGLFGAHDQGITPEDVKKFGEELDKLGKKADITIYPDAGHGFQNPVNGAGYKAEDTADAWSKILMFFARHLKS
jgi:carboxymethylenebutenolidase